jgi:S1-C subfamily serine protease
VPAAGGWILPPPAPVQRRRAGGAPIIALVVVLGALGAGIGYALWPSGHSKGVGAKSPTSSRAAVPAKVDPGLVDVNTTLGYQDEAAAGTGMVLISSGRVLTNNHVIDGVTPESTEHSPHRASVPCDCARLRSHHRELHETGYIAR